MDGFKIVIILICCLVGLLWDYYWPSEEPHKVNHLLARKNVDKMLKSSETAMPSPMQYYRGFKLYYDGVPDRYDLHGNKIIGVEPEPNKALQYLLKACQLSDSPYLWMRYGSIYQQGMYKLDPDPYTARYIYQWISERYPYHTEAAEKVQEVTNEINDIEVYRWLNLKRPTRTNTHHDTVTRRLNALPTAATMGTGLGGFGVGAGGVTRVNRVFRAPDINDITYNDTQNTHNPQVIATVAQSLKRLKDSTNIRYPLQESIKQLRSFIMTKPECDRRSDALKSLDSIERNIIPVTAVDMKETDALNLVWNRINSYENPSDLKDILYQQLSDMQEHGASVCSTGRLTRLVDTFSTIDKDVEIKPTYVINKEMMEKAGKIREDMYAGYSPDTVDKLRAGTADSTIQSDFDKTVRNKVLETLTTEYVNSGIMTPAVFTKTTQEWIDEI